MNYDSKLDLSQYQDPYYQALTSKPCLVNSIHPAIQDDNWEISESTLEQTRTFLEVTTLARQLATLFLTTPSLQDWWLHTMSGVKTINQETGAAVLERCSNEVAASKHVELRSILVNSNFGIKCYILRREDGYNNEALALVQDEQACYFDRSNREYFLRHHPVVIWINRGFCDFAIHCFDKAPLYCQENFLVKLALNLFHELAHVVYGYHRTDLILGEVNLGALHHGQESVPEMGHSWESWLIGDATKAIHAACPTEPMEWLLKTLSPIRTYDCQMKRHGLIPEQWHHNHFFNTYTASGPVNMRLMLKLLESTTWNEIAVKGPVWFRDGPVLFPSILERRQLLENHLEAHTWDDAFVMPESTPECEEWDFLYSDTADWPSLTWLKLTAYRDAGDKWLTKQGFDPKTLRAPCVKDDIKPDMNNLFRRTPCEL
ncbi:hypothetical protein EJ08DRAFT_658605 [Tothia fuscella]|uniref:Uncharacterized protein n=1 Tax=Tothia fuscella TaxID=1048955 RepID=A0A9P4U1G2_9PEZI|nr:hypothetical protein EJ08DRAFT_658605 [Tothia fuscella]